MIGLFTQNKNTEQQLISLLSPLPIEPYNPQKSYTCLIWLSNKVAPSNVYVLTEKEQNYPLTLSQWQLLVQKHNDGTIQYQNATFLFDSATRLITHLKTKKQIALTEKENALFAFLAKSKSHTASRDELLQTVWQYSLDAETHTLESHFYALKQKLGKDASKLIRFEEGVFSLV